MRSPVISKTSVLVPDVMQAAVSSIDRASRRIFPTLQAVVVLCVLAVVGGCTAGSGEESPVDAPAARTAPGPQVAQALRPGLSTPGYRVLGEFVAELDPVSGVATARMLEPGQKQSSAVPGLDTSLRSNDQPDAVDGRMRFLQDASGNGQSVAACEVFWDNAWSGGDTSSPFWVPGAARPTFLEELAGDLGENRFCTNFRLINDVGRPLQEIWIIVDGITMPGVRAWVQSFPRVIPSQVGEEDVILEPNSLQGMFRYGPFNEGEEVLGQWYFYLGGAPLGDFRVRGRIVEIFREQCGTENDDNGDGLEDSGCARFAAGDPCSMNEDCVSGSCDGGVPINPATGAGTLGTCEPSPENGACFEDTDCDAGLECDGGDRSTWTEGECVVGVPTFVWSSAGSTDTTDPANWTPAGVPGPTDMIRFDGTSSVDADFPPDSVLFDVTLALGYTGTVLMGDGTTITDKLWVQEGSVDNIGTLTVAGEAIAGSPGQLVLNGYTVFEDTLTIHGGEHGTPSSQWELQNEVSFTGETELQGTSTAVLGDAQIYLNGHDVTIETLELVFGASLNGGSGALEVEYLTLMSESLLDNLAFLTVGTIVAIVDSSEATVGTIEGQTVGMGNFSELTVIGMEVVEFQALNGSVVTVAGPGEVIAAQLEVVDSVLDLRSSEATEHRVGQFLVGAGGTVLAPDAVLEVTGFFGVDETGTFDAGEGEVRLGPGPGELFMNVVDLVFHDLTFAGPGQEFVIVEGSSFTVNGTWTVEGTEADPIEMRSFAPPQRWTVELLNAPVINHVRVRDSENNSTFRIEPVEWEDLGNNEGWGPEVCLNDADCPDTWTFCDIGTGICEPTSPVTLAVTGTVEGVLELAYYRDEVLFSTVTVTEPIVMAIDDTIPNGSTWRLELASTSPAGAPHVVCELSGEEGVAFQDNPNQASMACIVNPWESSLHRGELHWEPTLHGGLVTWPELPGTTNILVTTIPGLDLAEAEPGDVTTYEDVTSGLLVTGEADGGQTLYLLREVDGVITDWTTVRNTPMSIMGTVSTVAHEKVEDVLHVGGAFMWVGASAGHGVLYPDDDVTEHALAMAEVDGTIHVAIPDGEDGWFIGGDFNTVGGEPRPRLARLDARGQLHPWTSPAPDNVVHALEIHDGTLYVGGTFMTVGGTSRQRLAAIDIETGSLSPFTFQVEGSGSARVMDLAVCGGALYVGGQFAAVGGVESAHIAAVDLDTATVDPIGAADWVGALATDGEVMLVTGAFMAIAGLSRQKLVAIDCTTRAVNGWNLNLGGTGGGSALAIHDGMAWVGGQFSSVGGTPRTNLARFNLTNGTVEPWTASPPTQVTALAVRDGGLWVARTATTDIQGWSPQVRVYDTNTGSEERVVPLVNPGGATRIHTLALSGSTVLAGGDQLFSSARFRTRLAEFDAVTGQLNDWAPQISHEVRVIAYGDGDIFVGGVFTSFDGFSRNRLVAVDRVTRTVLPWDPDINGPVEALLVHDGAIHVGGTFTTVDGLQRDNYARFQIDELTLDGFSPLFDDTVHAFAVRYDTVYIGGAFTEACTGEPICFVDPRYRLAAFDTTSDSFLAFGELAGPDTGAVRALAADDTYLYVGGTFTSALAEGVGSLPVPRIIAYEHGSATLTVWPDAPDNHVLALTLDEDEELLHVGGSFMSMGSWQRSLGAVFSVLDEIPAIEPHNPAIDGSSTRAVVVMPNGDVVYGGTFTGASGDLRRGIVVTDPSGASVQ